jgi:hypothetical protein
VGVKSPKILNLTNGYPNNNTNNKKKKNNKVKSKPLELRSRVKRTIFWAGVGKLFEKHFSSIIFLTRLLFGMQLT